MNKWKVKPIYLNTTTNKMHGTLTNHQFIIIIIIHQMCVSATFMFPDILTNSLMSKNKKYRLREPQIRKITIKTMEAAINTTLITSFVAELTWRTAKTICMY